MALRPPKRLPEYPTFSATYDPDLSDNPRFAELLGYWRRKRGDRAVPSRCDFDVLEQRGHLGSLNIIEHLPAGDDFLYRLIGTEVAAAYGRDNTGKTVREIYAQRDPAHCTFLLSLFRSVVEQKAVVRLRGTLLPVDREYRRLDAILLPFAGAAGQVSWIVNEALFS